MSARENLGRLSLLELLRQLTVAPSDEQKRRPRSRKPSKIYEKRPEPFEMFDDVTATEPGF